MEDEVIDDTYPSFDATISEEESQRLFKDFEERLVAYIYGTKRPHCNEPETQLDSDDPDSLEAFWQDARERLLQHHLDKLQIRCARILRDLGGGDKVDAIIDDMEQALAEGRRTLRD
jgi:hypothetical protein